MIIFKAKYQNFETINHSFLRLDKQFDACPTKITKEQSAY